MKRVYLAEAIITMLLLTTVTFGQTDCKVLLPSISDSYTGSCKNGLAEGKGEASGIDNYSGDFKKGLPDGVGTYTWKTGAVYYGEWKKGFRNGKGEFTFNYMGKDSVQSGEWKADKYVEKGSRIPYTIGYRNNVGRVAFWKVNDKPFNVKYKFSRAGEASSFIAITNLLLNGSSGTENISTSFTGFENVSFPFEGKVRFNAPNSFNTASLDCEFRFVINEPGEWMVTIYY